MSHRRDPDRDTDPAPTPPPSRLVARRRAELLALCETGDLAHAVDLAFEHLAAHGPDPALLGALCHAGREAGLGPVARSRLHDLIRAQVPGLDPGADPCAHLLAPPGPTGCDDDRGSR